MFYIRNFKKLLEVLGGKKCIIMQMNFSMLMRLILIIY